MKILLICGTPFQTFNTLNIVYSSKGKSFDICIFDRFNLAREYTEKIRTLPNINKCVFIADYNKDYIAGYQLKGFIKNLHSVYVYLHPKKSLKNFFTDLLEWEYFTSKDRYDLIMAPTPSFFLQCIEKLNQGASLDYYEDGLGSYLGDFNKESASIERKLFSKIFKVGYNVLPVRTLYVYNPSICKSTVAKTIKQLPIVSISFLNKVGFLFEKSSYKNTVHYIWFTQITLTGTDKDTLKILKEISQDVMIRMHPKDRNIGFYKEYGFDIDDGSNLWEYIIGKTDIENTVLISASSTAMMTPKLLYDKEPYIIFTYKLYGIIDGVITDVDIIKIDYVIRQIRNLYRKKNRVLVPSSIEELRDMIKELE